MRRALVCAAAAALVAGGGPLAGPAGAGGGCSTDVTIHAVTQVGTDHVCWQPVVARVPVGATLAFVNDGGMAHNLSGPGPIGGHDLPMGTTVRIAFPTAGVYPFSCSLHPAMAGAVVVGDPLSAAVEGDPPAPPTAATSAPAVSLSTPDDGSPRIGTVAGAGAAAALAAAGVVALRRRRGSPVTP